MATGGTMEGLLGGITVGLFVSTVVRLASEIIFPEKVLNNSVSQLQTSWPEKDVESPFTKMVRNKKLEAKALNAPIQHGPMGRKGRF